VVYTAGTLSLAALELFVHLDVDDVAADLAARPAEIPEEVPIARLGPAHLPPGWRAYPAPEAVTELGMRWIEDAVAAVLAVPSAVIPRETNYLLNPRHPDFKKIRPGAAEPFSFDPRMWKTVPAARARRRHG
jgi:RES domain-containing protein